MRKLTFIVSVCLLPIGVFAQAPQKINYQAVIRDHAGGLITDQQIGMKMSIFQGETLDNLVYSEIYNPNPATNNNGLVSIEIGGGIALQGTFSAIDWADGPYFIQTETDPTGGTNYTIVGNSRLLSVPYALHAGNGVKTGVSTNEMMVWNGTEWVTIAPPTEESQVLVFKNGQIQWRETVGGIVGDYPKNYVHCGTPTGVVDVTSTTGKVWMDRNLGANRKATSSTDVEAYGSLFQWGRLADGHQCINRFAGDGVTTSGTVGTQSPENIPGHGNFITGNTNWRNPQENNLWQGVNGINNPCPGGYRLPTNAELDNERASWSTNNAAGAFGSPLKLPVAGFRNDSYGSLLAVGSYGYYWTSTVSGTDARYLFFYSSGASMSDSYRASGYSVRCLKD